MADVLLARIDSEAYVYPVATEGGDRVIHVSVIEDYSQVYGVAVSYGHGIFIPRPIASMEEVFLPRMFGGDLRVTIEMPINESLVFQPKIAISQDVVIESFIEDETLFQPRMGGSSDVAVENYIGTSEEFFPLTVGYANRIILESVIPSGQFFYPVRISGQKAFPLTIKNIAPDGTFLGTDISPFQSYYSLSGVIDDSSVRRARSASIITAYTPSEEAMFLGTYYTAFYIYNPGEILGLKRENIYLNITGGTRYRIRNLANPTGVLISEAAPFVADLTEQDKILLTGTTRTSTFGQVNISLLPSPDGEIAEFSRDGSSRYFDLRNQVFIPGNQRIRIPDLMPDEYYGVYVKVETMFSPINVISKDYAFINLVWQNNYLNGGVMRSRDSYPGQSETETGAKLGQLLPSIYFEFTTGYENLIREIDTTTEKLHNRYPPYFLSYDDVTSS